MYNILHILSVPIITGLISGCYNSKKESKVENGGGLIAQKENFVNISIDENLNNEINILNLSDAVSSIEIIPLEFTDLSAIRNIVDVGIADEDVIITFYRKLLRFSRSGKFLNEIGRFGNGPEEYHDTYLCMIRPSHKEVHVFDANGTKVFSFDGNFKRVASKHTHVKVFLPSVMADSFSDYIFLHQYLQIDPNNIPIGGEFWSIALVDSVYNPQKKFYNPDYKNRYQEFIKEENMLSHTSFKNHLTENPLNEDFSGEKFKMKYYGVDTVYQFNEKNLTFDPVYSLSLGKRPSFEMSHSWIKDPAFFDYLWVYDFYDSKDFLYFLAGKDDMVYTIQYNKTSKEIRVRKDKSVIRENRFPNAHTSVTHRRLERQFKLTNDISGGIDFSVDYKLPGGYWVSVNQPSDLLEKIDIEALKKANVKDPAARDRLVKVLSNLSEEDNPVLIVAKVK